MPDKQNIRSILILILPIVVLVVIAEVMNIRLVSRIATTLLILGILAGGAVAAIVESAFS